MLVTQLSLPTGAPVAELAPPLEERVLVISLWQPYAGLVVAGVKTLETRTWPWPYEPRWLVVHASKRPMARADEERLADKLDRVSPPLLLARGALLGLVRVTGPSRPLLHADEDAACFYEPGRVAWPFASATPFPRPVPVPRGPQKFSSMPRADVVRLLRGEP